VPSLKPPLELESAPAQRGPPGDRFPRNLVEFIWRMSGWRQAALCVFAAVIAALNFLPVELQRRLVDDAITPGRLDLLIVLGVTYGGVIVTQIGAKYVLMVLQSWLGESAVKHARDDLIDLLSAAEPADKREAAGVKVTIIGTEVDKVGSFIGESISQACMNAALLCITAGYMAIVQPMIALFSLVFLLPQALLTPLLQGRINRLVQKHLGLVRRLGDQVVELDEGKSARDKAAKSTAGSIFKNRVRLYFLKYGLKSLLNFANAMGPLSVLIVGGYMVIKGQTTIGVVLAFVSGFERLAQPIRELVTFYRDAAQTKVQIEMVADWVEAQIENGNPAAAETLSARA
jgi:ABC-type bacteriocin/lantibiotic exporter with double-glycine peptidase domain